MRREYRKVLNALWASIRRRKRKKRETLAAECGKTTLYKFRPFTEDTHRERVRQVFEDHTIYFSRRSELNDPFDLAPIIRLDGDHNDPRLRERLIADGLRVWRRNEPDLPAAEIDRRCANLSTCDLAEFERDAHQKALVRIERDYWVFSLAGNRDHPMLWSHYAAGHTGLCVHFLADRTSLFGGSQRVAYVDERPMVRFPFKEPYTELAEGATLSKGKFWEYEEEYRFIRYPNVSFEELGLKFTAQHAAYSTRLLTGVTVGSRMQNPEIDAVVKMATKHEPPIPVWRARETRTFTFEFDQIS